MNTPPNRSAHSITWCIATLALLMTARPSVAKDNNVSPLWPVLREELDLSMAKLVSTDGARPYFLQYEITDTQAVNVVASLGTLTSQREGHVRQLDVDVRCGDYARDNTRQIRGSGSGGANRGRGASALPLNGDPLGTQQIIWLTTDSAFKAAVKRFAQVKANLTVKVEEDDKADDFSREKPVTHLGPWVKQAYDLQAMAQRARTLSRRFRAYPKIYGSNVAFSGSTINKLTLNSEGSQLQYGRSYWRVSVSASTVADDGMKLSLFDTFDAATPQGLPDDALIAQATDKLINNLLRLRDAPVVEPYTGPAILLNRASGVFFHEIFGHRIEGHRQKNVEEGQTFAKKIGQPVLPEFLSVVDDPTIRKFGGVDLNGFYEFDDEAVPAQPAHLIENGILKTFLMSRSPTRGVTQSNGHGRRQPGRQAVSRQGNLIVQSTRKVTYDTLRQMLIEECRKQGKAYGLLFSDITGGFTTTRRTGPQAFKITPLMVYRVYADGRPNELVRGVDVVGTPLTSFSKILQTADDAAVFNGYCGAESGSIPVSAISPSILVEQIEVEKKEKSQERPPILPPPIAEDAASTTASRP